MSAILLDDIEIVKLLLSRQDLDVNQETILKFIYS